MQEQAIIEAQLEFFRKGGAGCLFAAHAARDPGRFGWKLSVSDTDVQKIEELIRSAISVADVSTQSIIFPSVLKWPDLKNLLAVLRETPLVALGQQEEFADSMCLGYRITVGEFTSWVTGFGGFDFLPKTRQSVFTEITFRSKPRPPYDWVMKETPPGVIHLADMDMKGMGENKFKSLWYGSFARVKEILGEKPDLRSAAKTTFAVPLELWSKK
ncbi:MAG: hypothetical protein AAB452_01185 [Patescibacteria group bacterium]